MAAVDLSRIPPYYHNYIRQVPDTDLSAALDRHQTEILAELKAIPEDRWDYRYAEGKWSIREVVLHVIDAERIFSYRALRFARKDTTNLPGFDENLFAGNSKADRRSKDSLLEELSAVQKATQALFASFDEEQLDHSGTANNNTVYVGGIGFILVGHARHHLNILKERYLSKANS